MSMSTHVIGIKPPDDLWVRMKAAWDACLAAGVAMPDGVEEFFNDEDPDPAGVLVEVPTRKWSDNSREGVEVDLADLPAHIKTIRFYNAW